MVGGTSISRPRASGWSAAYSLVVGASEDRSRAWAEIDLGALERNYREARSRAAGRRVITVVKANGYGHGATLVARALAAAGCDALAVVSLAEARELRDARVSAPLLVLGGLLCPEDADSALELDAALVVSRTGELDWLEAAAARAGRAARVHAKVDTGMGRLGMPEDEIDAFVARLRRARGVLLEGVMSHLAEADDAASPRTQRQRERLREAVARVRDAGLDPAWIHIDNSAGLLRGPAEGTTAVRPGLMLYGADPTLEGGHAGEPVMTLVARVCLAKTLPAGARVGYGGTFETRAPTRILTLPIGYADGLPRAAASSFRPGWRGRRVPLAGRISCDLSALDAGSAEGGLGEEVLLFGRRDGLEIRVEELARAAGTLSYEILVGIGGRIPRLAS